MTRTGREEGRTSIPAGYPTRELNCGGFWAVIDECLLLGLGQLVAYLVRAPGFAAKVVLRAEIEKVLRGRLWIAKFSHALPKSHVLSFRFHSRRPSRGTLERERPLAEREAAAAVEAETVPERVFSYFVPIGAPDIWKLRELRQVKWAGGARDAVCLHYKEVLNIHALPKGTRLEEFVVGCGVQVRHPEIPELHLPICLDPPLGSLASVFPVFASVEYVQLPVARHPSNIQVEDILEGRVRPGLDNDDRTAPVPGGLKRFGAARTCPRQAHPGDQQQQQQHMNHTCEHYFLTAAASNPCRIS